jgi:threonine dehydratase
MTMSETLTASLARLPVTPRDIEAAASVLAGHVKRTNFDCSRTLSDIAGENIWLKFEHMQFTATFKERGALNRLSRLSALSADERRQGVIAASAGNHAQGVAYHAACAIDTARYLGIDVEDAVTVAEGTESGLSGSPLKAKSQISTSS